MNLRLYMSIRIISQCLSYQLLKGSSGWRSDEIQLPQPVRSDQDSCERHHLQEPRALQTHLAVPEAPICVRVSRLDPRQLTSLWSF